jgi:hypothetical protein
MPTLDSNCWVTLDDLKEHMDIPSGDTTKDDFLTNILNGAYHIAKNYIGHDLIADDYTEYHDGDGEDTILLKVYPVNTIASIYDDTSREFGSDSLIDVDDYFFDAQTGLVTLFQGSASFKAGKGNIKVTYNAGYTTIPYDAQRGLIMLAAWLAQRAGTEGLTTATLGGKSEQYDSYNIPLFIRQCFIPYKNMSV